MDNSDEKSFYLYLIALGYAYFSIVILPYIVLGFGYSPWIISIPDLIDLVFYPIAITIILIFMHNKISNVPNWSKLSFAFFTVMHLYGSGFHWAANAIHETIKHTVPSSSMDAVKEALNYAYFLDEILSHKIFFYSLYILLLIVTYWATIREFNIENKTYIYLGDISSIISGFSIMVSTIEGQSPYETLIFAILVVIILLVKIKDIKEILSKPVARYMFLLAILTLFFAALYIAIFGSFVQPSEVL